MQPITYLVFTLVSILIQFCVMDFINDTIEDRHEISISKRNVAMSRIVEKPHGLFYRTSNTSVDVTTEMTSTILDWIYDDNISTTEENFFTEISTSNYENVTEVALFNKSITTKPELPKSSEGNCGCNILYKTCDINCCCDTDCSDAERRLFPTCEQEKCLEQNLIHSCDSCQMKHANYLENLFCISKTNLPDKRLTDIQFDEAAIYKFHRWHNSAVQEESNDLGIYKYNDPIWLVNESRFYAEIPIAVANNYCNDRKPIRFLRNEDINCIVKLQDLHMFQAFRYMDSRVLSLEEAFNNTKSETVHTNWTLVICDDYECRIHNKTRDEPHCTDNICNNIATTVQYNFYYYNSRITKAVLKLYVRKLSMRLPFITQNVKVKFYLRNDLIENAIKLSGNPGYNRGLPIITSSAESNHSLLFFSTTSGRRILTYPDNKNGECLSSNVTYKIIQFGHNKRSKCRFHPQIDLNVTSPCHSIQNQIFHLLGVNSTLYVSPYGNPEGLSDEDWLRMRIERPYLYGVVRNKELTCNNIIVGIGFIFVFESRRNKIVHANVEGTAQNITFDTDDVSTVVTVDTSFIELRNSFEFAGAPHLSVNLPRSFFLPNKGNIRQLHVIVLIIALTIK